jgi:predicted AAA+ superfamily ATPase
VVDNGFVGAKAFSVSDNLGRLLENQVFVELIRQGYDPDKTMFYYHSRNDKEVDFVLRKGTHIERLVQVCYVMSSPKTAKREVESLLECAGELKCNNLVIVTNHDERIIEKDNYRIEVMPVSRFFLS